MHDREAVLFADQLDYGVHAFKADGLGILLHLRLTDATL